MSDQPPPSRQIAADLREAIRRGEYSPGHQLPSGRNLAERYGVARLTVQKAIDALRAEGLIVGYQGAGWFVREKPKLVRSSRYRFSRRERGAGRGATVTDADRGGWEAGSMVTVRFEPACEHIATELRIEPGERVTIRERVMTADGRPVQLSTSWLPRSITRGTAIERKNTGPGGLYARLEEAGHQLERFEERVSARMASGTEADALELGLGDVVLHIVRVAYGAEDRPLELNSMILRADRYELVYDLPAD